MNKAVFNLRCRDYYGNYVPSRFEVKSGSKGSLAYQKMMKEMNV